MSRSLHSSIEYLGGSNRWSRNESDIEPEKSSIGEISSKISSRPEVVGTLCRLPSRAAATRACHLALPSSQSKLSVCNARRFGTSRGSRILPKEIRPEAVRLVEPEADAVREAAKRGPSTGLAGVTCARQATRGDVPRCEHRQAQSARLPAERREVQYTSRAWEPGTAAPRFYRVLPTLHACAPDPRWH